MMQWKKIELRSRGLKLVGLLHGTPELTDVVLVIAHGFQGSKEGAGRAVEMAEWLSHYGYAAILFDFAGCGESEGDFADISLTNQIADLGSVVEFCRGLGFKRVVSQGRSFGGATALCHAARDTRVAGVCVWAAPVRLMKLFGRRKTALNGEYVRLSYPEGSVLLGRTFFDDLALYDVASCAAKVHPRPLLIIHGEEDEVVPVEDAHLLFAKAQRQKELVLVPGGDHRFTQTYQDAWKALLRWLKTHFPSTFSPG